VSVPTLWVIGSFITTSTLHASFSLEMANFRSSPDRKAELPFITLSPRFTVIKVGLAHSRTSRSSRALGPPQPGAFMLTGPPLFCPQAQSLQQKRSPCFLSECQLAVQGAGQGVLTACPVILTCPLHSDPDKEAFQAIPGLLIKLADLS
jgi:hypothetical protein